MNRQEKCDKIYAAYQYRNGQDSINSVYMGSMATASLIHKLGGSYGYHSVFELLETATNKQIDSAFEYCKPYIDCMEKYPTTKFPCCGQIVSK